MKNKKVKTINKPIIIITGCARSGTSMTAGIIELCGGWGGELCGPTTFNPKGQFENISIVRGFIKPFLKDMGYDPMGQKPLPDPTVINAIATDAYCKQFREKIEAEVIRQGGENNDRRFFYKGAKVCLIWQLWAKAFPDAQWIITSRRDRLIISSCHNTRFMKKYDTNEGWQEWIDYHKDRFKEMDDTGLDISYVDTEKLVHGNQDEMRAAIDNLGLEWNQAKIDDFIDIDIWQTVK